MGASARLIATILPTGIAFTAPRGFRDCIGNAPIVSGAQRIVRSALPCSRERGQRCASSNAASGWGL